MKEKEVVIWSGVVMVVSIPDFCLLSYFYTKRVNAFFFTMHQFLLHFAASLYFYHDTCA